ncbi:MAG: hypothetical protein ACTHN5_09720 [Phycisphaerae bacterium]
MPTPSLTPITPPPAKPVKKTWRRFFKRLALGLAGLLIILLVVFLLLPSWISNDQGRTYVLQQLNKRTRAQIAIGEWTLGWFHATDLHNVTITLPDPHGQGSVTLFSSPHVRSELTLWSLFWGHYDLGTTTIETPQVNLTRYPDGSTSFDALVDPSRPNPFRKFATTLRGAVQFSNGSLTLNSIATGQSVSYSNLKAALTIASPYAPFHFQLNGISPGRTLSVATSFPPLRNWSSSNWPQVLATSSFDCSATNLPTALLCDWTSLDPRWQESIGPTLSDLTLSNHPAPPGDSSTLALQCHGAAGSIDAVLAAHAANLRSPATFSLADPAVHHVNLSLAVSPPLARLLRHVNPLFAELQSGNGPISLSLADLQLNSAAWSNAQLSARFTFPNMTFRRAGLIAQLLKLASPDPAATSLAATAEPFRLRLLDGAINYDNLTVNFRRIQRLTFRGTVRFNGALNLLATVPADSGPDGATLGSMTAEIPITGTIDHPTATLPQ